MSLLTLPRAGMPLLGENGQIASEWYRFLRDLTVRAGGVDAPTNNEAAEIAGGNAGIEEIRAIVEDARNSAEFYQLQTDLQVMRASLYDLQCRIDSIEQAPSL
jgi:hypothetical protein